MPKWLTFRSAQKTEGLDSSGWHKNRQNCFSPIYPVTRPPAVEQQQLQVLTSPPVPYYVNESTVWEIGAPKCEWHAHVFSFWIYKKSFAHCLPCNSSNCRSPCDCKNTGSGECDARDRVAGAILPTLVAARAGAAAAAGAPVGDGSESDDDGPWCSKRKRLAGPKIDRLHWAQAQGALKRRGSCRLDYISSARAAVKVSWFGRLDFRRYTAERLCWMLVLGTVLWRRTTTALTLG